MIVKDVIEVKSTSDFLIQLVFTDGESRILDFKEYAKGKGNLVADIVKDIKLFNTVALDGTGTICWANGYDIAQEYLYETSKPV